MSAKVRGQKEREIARRKLYYEVCRHLMTLAVGQHYHHHQHHRELAVEQIELEDSIGGSGCTALFWTTAKNGSTTADARCCCCYNKGQVKEAFARGCRRQMPQVVTGPKVVMVNTEHWLSSIQFKGQNCNSNRTFEQSIGGSTNSSAIVVASLGRQF